MIICYIDNKKVFPNTTDKIKVTYENQFIKDSGSYTYEISFPMSIQANKEFFKNINRFDVKKKIQSFENCALLVDNRLIISGKGHITSVTAAAVKLQIAGGKSRIKYNSVFEKHFIDEIKYPQITITHGINKIALGGRDITPDYFTGPYSFIPIDLTTFNYVGQENVVAFNPIYDETNEFIANQIFCMDVQGEYYNGAAALMFNLAPQPFLMYVISQVLEFEGYKLIRNDFNCDPWNRLIIANAKYTLKIAEALPHWTIYKFLDEVRKLFNASFVFDEMTKTVQLLSQNELTGNLSVSYDCDDDYSSEFDEDSFENIATSNVEYSFDDSTNRDNLELMPIEVLRKYPTKEYATISEMEKACNEMSKRERFTTIFRTGGDNYIYATRHPVFGNTEHTIYMLTKCGIFAPLTRDINSDSIIKLNIIPAAMFTRKRWEKEKGSYKPFDKYPHDVKVYVPSVSNENKIDLEKMTKDEDTGEYYLSVEEALSSGVDSSKKEEDNEDEKMKIVFQGQYIRGENPYTGMLPYHLRFQNENTKFRLPITFTEADILDIGIYKETGSLSLNHLPHGSLGAMHKAANIDSKNKLCIKFYTDEIPDPSKIYNFRNKLFICEKVELEIDANGISKQKTGYFYEFL